MERDQAVHTLRSQIQYEAIQTNPHQIFQDNTLRPILKFQHQILLLIFNEFIEKNAFNFQSLNVDQRNNTIEQIIKQNPSFQTLLKGIVIALFDTQEIEYWSQHKSEINKRIIQLAIKRIQTSI
jgi:hypothetical protein